MDDPSASALMYLAVGLIPLVLLVNLAQSRVKSAVSGSHQRWLWGGIYRMCLMASILSSGSMTTATVMLQDPLGTAMFGSVTAYWIFLWVQWSNRNSDDDFWNSFGKKVKGLPRRLAGALSAGPKTAPSL